MPDPEKVAIVASEWVAKAENDLKTAAHTLKLGKDCPTDTVCFHAQQVVEKYLKALLTVQGNPFPKTHNVGELMAQLPARVRPRLSEDQQDVLTDYATGARYPGWGPIPLAEARRAVAMARRVRADARRILPKEALTRRRQG
ncbi:MAG: HEPN domain-containing protein [Dongiaceae bacterium]